VFKNILKQKINIIDNSMEPTLKHGDFIVMRKIIFFYDPKRFDLISFKNNGMNLIKRVVGVKDEIIEISKGNLIINENLFKEDFIENKFNFNFPKTILKKDEVFVLGDNREFSKDSRNFGAIKIKNILSFYRP
tara:strand:+ start:109 stop:507 length:399 start_codon:yes stop_codon:yes gene_type:complete